MFTIFFIAPGVIWITKGKSFESVNEPSEVVSEKVLKKRFELYWVQLSVDRFELSRISYSGV